MTITRPSNRSASSALSSSATSEPQVRPRLIAVGVRDERDRSTLAWALDDAVPRLDGVHVVHAFVPLRIEGCSWAPVVEGRAVRVDTAQRVVSRALQQLRSVRPDVRVDGSAVRGAAADVLTEFSDVVDLVVLGEDEAQHRSLGMTTRRVLGYAKCPVVVVPADYADHQVDPRLPVTVAVDTLDLPSTLLEVGLHEASRRRTALRVAHIWSALHEEPPWTAELVANRQAQLDMQLSDWRGSRPIGGLVGELMIDDSPDALAELRVGSQLLVVSSTSIRLLGPSDAGKHRCPALIIPDGLRS
jgi:nucleotide-binding universal stress UspA family protein